MSEAVSIAGQGGKISIEVLGYENPRAQNTDDANWLATQLRVEIGPFTGKFKAALTTSDLVVLHERLEEATRSLSGRVCFQSTEDNLILELAFSRDGTAELEGVVQPSGANKAALHYRFETDAGFLTRAVQELKLLVEEFPVKLATVAI